MQWRWLPKQIEYTGRELRSHWLNEVANIQGDAIVAFAGPCQVPVEHLVDQKDVRRGVGISAAQMLHFISEQFETDLVKATLRQRLLVCLATEIINSRQQVEVQRQGDDLFVGERKLSVSIATVSPVSTLIHLGLNIDPTGAPVPAIGLAELGLSPPDIAEQIMTAYVAELQSCYAARCQVRGVP